MRGQSRKVEVASRAPIGVGQDRINANQIDGHSGQDLLHMGADQPIIARATQPHGSHSLRKRALDACTQGIRQAKGGRLLDLSLLL